MKSVITHGSYKTSYFYIKIYTKKDIQTWLKEDGNIAYWIHEIIHYLQDLVLPYNINQILYKAIGFEEVISFINKEGYLKLDFNDNWSQQYNDLKALSVKTFGSLNQNEISGARDFLEYIAYKIECKLSPNCDEVSQCRYELVDLFFKDRGFPSTSDAIKICVAEFCLYNDKPLDTLYRLFNDKNLLILINKNEYQEVYKYLMSYPVVAFDCENLKTEDIAVIRREKLIKKLKCQYNGYDAIVKWIIRATSFIMNNYSGKFLFSDIYNMDTTNSKKELKKIIEKIGIPLVLNSQNQCISVGFDEKEEKQFINFYIMRKFMSFVSHKSSCCPICDLCSTNTIKKYLKCKIKKGIIIGEENCYYNRFLNNYGICNLKYNII